jgi:Protein of unknown function (DUF4231)
MAAGQKGRQQAPNFEPLWERLTDQVDWYDRKAKANQRAYKVSKIAIIVLAILIPVFAEYGMIEGMYDTRAFLVGAASGAIVLLEGLQVLNKWQENGSSIGRPARACATSSISSPRWQALTPISGQRRRRGCWPSGRAAWSWPSIPNGRTRARPRPKRPRGEDVPQIRKIYLVRKIYLAIAPLKYYLMIYRITGES